MGKRPPFARIADSAMKRRDFVRRFLVSGLGAALGLLVLNGRGAALAQGRGPPPRAPAHGYRHKHPSGAELIFDGDIGAYLVVGLVDLFFRDGRFYRFLNGSWTASAGLGGPWNRLSAGAVPAGLLGKFSGARPPAKRGGGGGGGGRGGRGKGKGKGRK